MPQVEAPKRVPRRSMTPLLSWANAAEAQGESRGPDTSQDCSPEGRLTVAADLPIYAIGRCCSACGRWIGLGSGHRILASLPGRAAIQGGSPQAPTPGRNDSLLEPHEGVDSSDWIADVAQELVRASGYRAPDMQLPEHVDLGRRRARTVVLGPASVAPNKIVFRDVDECVWKP